MMDARDLLALPFDERQALAEMLRDSVGYPVGLDSPVLPAWQLAQMVALLERFDD
jgi:hypothetical protein